jgi:hypothetical protein
VVGGTVSFKPIDIVGSTEYIEGGMVKVIHGDWEWASSTPSTRVNMVVMSIHHRWIAMRAGAFVLLDRNSNSSQVVT